MVVLQSGRLLRGSCSRTALAHSYLDAFPLLVHPQAGHIRATVMQAGVQELLLFIADPIPCRVEDEEQDHGDSDTQALEPRYSHHCYVRADDRHASAASSPWRWRPSFEN